MKRARILVVLLAGCGSSSKTTIDAAPPAIDAASSDAGNGCPDNLCLDPPAQGFQLRSVGTTIDPGQDVEYCEILAIPGTPSDTYYVREFDVAMSAGSHHLIVSAIDPGSPTDMSTTVGMRTQCIGAQSLGGYTTPVTGSQHPTHTESYPPGVGKIYTGGQKVIFDYHYFNSTDNPLPARAAVNFVTTDASNVTNLAHNFGFYDFAIDTPVGQTGSFTGECNFTQDVTIYKLTRHTHQWGTAFTAWWSGGPNDGQQIFTSPDWSSTDFVLPSAVTVPAGQGIRFECDYTNTTDHDLVFGLKATDEMCILFGTWWTPVAGAQAMDQSCQIFM
jgi:hypothetical protein